MFDFVSLPQTHVSNAGGEIFFRQLACTKYHDFIICDEGTAEGCLRSRFQGNKKKVVTISFLKSSYNFLFISN